MPRVPRRLGFLAPVEAACETRQRPQKRTDELSTAGAKAYSLEGLDQEAGKLRAGKTIEVERLGPKEEA